MTEQPGWPRPEPPSEPDPPARPPVTSGWAAEQPPPHGWGAPGYGGQSADQPPGPPPPGSPQGYPPPGYPPQPGWGSQPGWNQPTWTAPKPGVIPLRPLGVGEILDGAISTIRAKPKVMLGLSAVVAVLTQLITVPVSWALLHDVGDSAFSFDQSSSSAQDDVALTASSLTATALQLLVTLVATLLLTGMLTVVLSRAILGQDIDAGQAWAEARPRLPALLGVTVLVTLIGLGVTAVLLAPGIVLALSGSPGVAIALAFVVGALLLVCALPYLYVSFALAPAVVVLEKQGALASLTRSRRLVTGAWWRTFGILVLINIIASIVAGIFSGIFTFGALFASGVSSGFSDFNPYALVPLIITAVGAILGSAITWPFTAVASALIYVDRRIRREALDLELARAAGLTPQGQSGTPGTPLDSTMYGGTYGGGAQGGPPTTPYGG
jgi:hypothetical protein